MNNFVLFLAKRHEIKTTQLYSHTFELNSIPFHSVCVFVIMKNEHLRCMGYIFCDANV